MDIIIPIIADIVVSPFFSVCLGISAAWVMLLYGFWQWRQRHKRIQALVDRVKAIHAQAGTRPRHLPSLASSYHLFSESINWAFRLDRELNALERQRGMRVPYSRRGLSLSSGEGEEALNGFSRRIEALEGSQR